MRNWFNYHTIKKIETTKKLLAFTVALVIFITIVTVIAVFVLQDTSPLEFLIGMVGTLATGTFSLYLWKAKNENCAKYGNKVDENNDTMI